MNGRVWALRARIGRSGPRTLDNEGGVVLKRTCQRHTLEMNKSFSAQLP